MTSVLSSVTNWLGGVREPSPERTPPPGAVADTDQPADSSSAPERSPSTGGSPEGVGEEGEAGVKEREVDEGEGSKLALDVDLQEVSEKAFNAAKEWGSYLYSFGKAATEQVAKTAKQFKDTVEEKTIIGDFSREQDKFVTEKREKKKLSEAAVPPWVGYNEEETMKSQILNLSKEKRNFLRNPPAGVQFQFDYESSFPVAQVLLAEDPNLNKMRFELVPKQVAEETFWRNYFYRVSLIKQSTQLTTLITQQKGSSSGSSTRKSTGRDIDEPSEGVVGEEGEGLVGGGGGRVEHEFVSDTFQSSSDDLLDNEELTKELHQLGMTNKTNNDQTFDDLPEWEKELQAELQEYEVVDDGSNAAADADLEQEIMKQIEAEVQQQQQ